MAVLILPQGMHKVFPIIYIFLGVNIGVTLEQTGLTADRWKSLAFRRSTPFVRSDCLFKMLSDILPKELRRRSK